MIRISKRWLLLPLLSFVLTSAYADKAWNDPRHKHEGQSTSYRSFSGSPKTLDPAKAYSSDELRFLGQIVEPPLQYHYLKRPYELEPLTASAMPTITYLDKNKQPLSADASSSSIAYTRYDIELKPKIRYQQHPAFSMPPLDVKTLPMRIKDLTSFPHMHSRELQARDYVYAIKRLASPRVNSPIYGIMSDYIVGLTTLHKNLVKLDKFLPNQYLRLHNMPLEGAKATSKTHFYIIIKGKYPPFINWLAMPFFAPAPWEVDAFYHQPGMEARNLSWDTFPIGTGPYLLEYNDPNQKIVLKKNPHFRPTYFPNKGEANDQSRGYLHSADEQLPFIDTVIYLLDKESIPRWNKFLQGYLDHSGISADSFDQAIQINPDGQPVLTPELKKMGLHLQVTTQPTLSYIGFNMLDPVVGGGSERARLLRQAISIAINYEEYIALFLNGRGVSAQGPIPPGIIGYLPGKEGINPYTFDWFNGKPKRKSLATARRLLKQAGYPGGLDPATKEPLILHYDTASTGSPEDKAHFNWLRRQLSQLGIELDIQATLYNRFRTRIRTGQAQLFSWGWHADYPDPENFLFLLYGPNGKVKQGGENATNYQNTMADKLFEKIRVMKNSPTRTKIIQQLLAILQHDSPMIWGYHPISYTLSHSWNSPAKAHAVAQNTLKYEKLHAKKRKKMIKSLNTPVRWPVFVGIAFLLFIGIPALIQYRQKQRKSRTKRY